MTRRVTRGFDPARLRRAREENPNPGLRTRAEVARLAGIGGATLQHWENGTKSPQVDKLAQVCRTLGVSIEDVVDIPDEDMRLGDWRVRRGLLLPEVARRTELSISHVARIEAGQVVTLPVATAARLAAALDISVEQVQAAYERGRTRNPGEPA